MAQDETRDTVRRLAEHVAATRQRLADGKAEIERQRQSVAETERHLTGMSRWIEQTERHLGEQRARRPDAEGGVDERS